MDRLKLSTVVRVWLAGGVAVIGAALEPTLLGAPHCDAKVHCRGGFGDLVSIVPVDDFESALVGRVNDTRFGFQSGLFTRRHPLVSFAAGARTSTSARSIVNGASKLPGSIIIPFGGVKDSGLGRESPRWLIEDFSAVKTVVFRGQCVVVVTTRPLDDSNNDRRSRR